MGWFDLNEDGKQDAPQQDAPKNGEAVGATEGSPPGPDSSVALDTEKPNALHLLVGPPGYGKSTLGVELINERVAKDRIVLIHDPNQQFRATRFDTVHEFKREMAAQAKAGAMVPQVYAISAPGEGSTVVKTALELGERFNKTGRGVVQPIFLFLDEGTSLETSGPSWTGRDEETLIYQRRHYGIELAVNLQRPTQLGWTWWGVATDIHLFALRREDVITEAEKQLGLAKGTFAKVRALPQFQYAHYVAKPVNAKHFV